MPEQPNTYVKGLLGESAAETFLQQQGMVCLERRYHSSYGEIDLIMLDGDTLAFVEVKSRKNNTLYAAQAAVTLSKQRKIIQTALCFLNEHPEYSHLLMRFDVVALADDCISHIPNAFQGSGW